jgi:hypothetical protein
MAPRRGAIPHATCKRLASMADQTEWQVASGNLVVIGGSAAEI